MNCPETKSSPMMVQWQQCKAAAKDAILLFRLGDFYEAFYEDAVLISKELDLTLTKRQEVPMSGVPWHTSESYIDRLVMKGYKVALAEQTEDPKKCKGLVAREVKRFITPGTNMNASYLSEKANNYFAGLCQVGDTYGVSFVDLTTGECRVIELFNLKDMINELYRLSPKELLISAKFQKNHAQKIEELKTEMGCLINVIEDWRFDHKLCYDFLTNHFEILSLDGFGLKTLVAAINAAGALLAYLKDILCLPLNQIKSIVPYASSEFMEIDRATLSNLELMESLHDRSRRNTLLHLLDNTNTPMGARALRRFIVKPLLDVQQIFLRQEAVQDFLDNPESMHLASNELMQIRDLERLMMRIATANASPRDIVSLKNSLEPIPKLKSILQTCRSRLISQEKASIHELPALVALIDKALVESPPLRLSDGNLFKKGYSSQLDELHEISQGSKTWMMSYQNELRENTGIKTLKVGYTRVSGFFIEVSKGQLEKVPDNFIRKQTLTNAERFITPLLKEYEEKVLQSEERIAALESTLFSELRLKVSSYVNEVISSAKALGILDFLLSLAKIARREDYVRPIVDESGIIDIKQGKHPVIEGLLQKESFIPNDTLLDTENNRMMLITGPNMAGKSTYIRQVALLVILAQIGSFVPAKYAHIGIVDKLFTRIGASDDLARGHSTFMVEMAEAANILNNATSKSLVILDEIGRGTSTYDGISIAWSIAEYLLTTKGKAAKTLFATHYFELTKLEEKVPGVLNYTVAVHESGDQILFLRKIIRGKADKSYGIHVARLAGLPSSVLFRAKEILLHLEEGAKDEHAFETRKLKKSGSAKAQYTADAFQLTFFGE